MEETNHHFQIYIESEYRLNGYINIQYQSQSHINVSIYNNLMHPSKYDDWLRIINDSPNRNAAGPTGITYEMITFGFTLWNCHR